MIMQPHELQNFVRLVLPPGGEDVVTMSAPLL
jgi:hypothetical protein